MAVDDVRNIVPGGDIGRGRSVRNIIRSGGRAAGSAPSGGGGVQPSDLSPLIISASISDVLVGEESTILIIGFGFHLIKGVRLEKLGAYTTAGYDNTQTNSLYITVTALEQGTYAIQLLIASEWITISLTVYAKVLTIVPIVSGDWVVNTTGGATITTTPDGYLKKEGGGLVYTDTAYSTNQLAGSSGEQRLEFKFQVGGTGYIGLSDYAPMIDHYDVDWGFRFTTNTIYVYENGSYKTFATTTQPPAGTVFTIVRSATGVGTYYMDGVLKYTSSLNRTGVLWAAASLYDTTLEISDIVYKV